MCLVCILVLFCVYLRCPFMAGIVFILFDFIRDLYKCLALWGKYRQTQERTGRQAVRQVSFRLDETSSKPYISLALLSYWTLRLSSLHRASSIQPQNEERERESLGIWLIFASNIASVDGMIGLQCLRCLHGLIFFAVIIDMIRGTHKAP